MDFPNKFKGDTHGSFDPSSNIYTAPVAGYYTVGASVVKYKPTGRFEVQENYSRKWYQFWKPKKVLKEVYEREYVEEGSKIVYAKQGEVIGTKVEMRRVSS